MEKEEINKLIEDNINIAYELTHKYYTMTKGKLTFDELNSICNYGLVKAANTYNQNKGFAFSTYAYKVISNEIFNELRIYKKMNGYKFISLNDETREGRELKDIVSSDYNLELKFIENEELKLLKEFIEELPKLLKIIILELMSGKTQMEVADQLNVSQPQISRLRKQIINILRIKFEMKGMM